MDGQAEIWRPLIGWEGEVRMRSWRAVLLPLVGVLLLGLLVAWLVVSLFVLDVVVADAGNLALVVAGLVTAAWFTRKRKDGHPSLWITEGLTIMMLFVLLHDLATEHRWPPGQMQDLIIARRIITLPALACFAMAAISYLRKKRRTAKADGDLAAS